MVSQIFTDLFHSKSNGAEIPDYIQPPDIVYAVVAVARFGTLWLYQSDFFIVPDGIHTNII